MWILTYVLIALGLLASGNGFRKFYAGEDHGFLLIVIGIALLITPAVINHFVGFVALSH